MSGFKSQAQRNKCKKMMEDGIISKEQFELWDKATSKKIPERVKTKKVTKKK